MARRDRDFRNLLVDTIDGIRTIYATKDIVNDIDAHNQLVEAVNFLEDILTPYMNKSEITRYSPRQDGDEYQNIHYRIRNMTTIAMNVALFPPEEIFEDASEFDVRDL